MYNATGELTLHAGSEHSEKKAKPKDDSPEHEGEGQDLGSGAPWGGKCEVAGFSNDINVMRWCLGMTYPTWVHSNFSIVNVGCTYRAGQGTT